VGLQNVGMDFARANLFRTGTGREFEQVLIKCKTTGFELGELVPVKVGLI
jgi:ribosomal protein S19